MEFPADILVYNILSRLPVEPLFRCRCVSKRWHSLITTSTVFEKYYHLHHQKLLFLSSAPEKYFRTMDPEALQQGLTPARPLPPSFMGDDCSEIDIITSYHGLVCLGMMKEPTIYTHLVLWNPQTGEHKTLSNTNSTQECYRVQQRASVLYYNSFKDDYMLLRVTYNDNVYIYSLKSDSWRNIIYSSTPGGCLEEYAVEHHWTPSNPMNGIVYFMKIQMIENEEDDVISSLSSIIRFDIKTEKFTEGPTYSNDIGRITDCLSLTALPDHVRIYTSVSRTNWRQTGTTVECWRMNSRWYVPEIMVERFFDKPVVKWWQLMHVMQDDEDVWIMISNNAGYIMKVYMHDMNSHELLSEYKPYSMYISPRHKYITTYVSPNRYCGVK